MLGVSMDPSDPHPLYSTILGPLEAGSYALPMASGGTKAVAGHLKEEVKGRSEECMFLALFQ